MMRVILASTAVRQLPDADSWGSGGPVIVHDGFELEPGHGPVMRPACLVCSSTMPIDGADVLSALRIPDEPDSVDLISVFGLAVKRWNELGVVIDALGLSAHLLIRPCGSCGADHAVCLGYGEFQPARYLVTFNGLALIQS